MAKEGAQQKPALAAASQGQPLTSGVFTSGLRRQVWGACLWLDVTGFTTLTEQLSQQGPAGIESLSVTLDRLYARVGSSVADSNGQVLFFAGDGAMCLWVVDGEAQLSDALLAAAGTAIRLRRELEEETWHEKLEVRQVVVGGDLTLDTLGGEVGDALDIVSGPPLVGLSALSKLCRPAQVMLSAPSAQRLAEHASLCSITPEAVLLLDLNLAEPERAAPASLAVRSSRPSPSRPTPVDVASELRRVSVAFVHWSHAALPTWHELQALVSALQHVAQTLSGFLCQIVRDEKGFTGLVAFGLPGQAQGEESLRALRLALDFSSRALELGVHAKSGVATGLAFCGVCGTGAERQYCVLGNTVNRAARLTELSSAAPLVDEQTFAQTQRRFTFQHEGRLRLRGLKREVDVYRPESFRQAPADPPSLVGFEHEELELRQTLVDFAAGKNAALVIKGELGAGKSALLSRLPDWCSGLSLQLCVGVADEVDQYTGYFALRSVARELLGIAKGVPVEHAAMRNWALRAGHAPELAPLLNALFSSDHPPTPLVSGMSPETRGENRERLVADMLRLRLAGAPLVIALEDAQWLDASSLALLEYLSKRLPNVLCVYATRPGETHLSRRLSNARTLHIAALDAAALTRLVLDHADAEAVSAPVLQAVVRDTRGNPLHCIELVRGLLGSGRLVRQGGALAFAAGSGEELPIPGTLEDLILARFDALSPSTRQVLRTASVMGVAFDLRVMRVVLSSLMTAEQLDRALGEGVAQRMLRLNEGHEFEHASFRSVVYSLLLPSEQRALHERTALALQSVYGDRLQPIAARLAHHWLCAGNAGNAAEFSALAADLALQGYANVDAEHLFRQALEQDHVLRGTLSVDLRRAHWSISMAQALYSQSRHGAARGAYERALAWTGAPRPGGVGQLLLNIVRTTGGSYVRRLLRRPLALISGEQRERRLAAIRVIHAWATLDIWEGLLPQAANKAIIAYRLAESVVDAPEAAEIISGLGYMLATTPVRRHAPTHLSRALALAEATSDLQARTSTRVLFGMYLVLNGQTPRAEEPLRAAVALADSLGSGLWRHRAHFALAEWLLFAGQLEAAAVAFEEAANIAAAAEPPVQGFANCMAALALMRRGELERAYGVVSGERGLKLLDAECLVLQRFTSLGISAEIALRNGKVAEALTLADRALELSRTRRDVDVFFAALHGHAGTVFVFAHCLERLAAAPGAAIEGWDRRTLARKLKQAFARLSAFASMYPGARACAEHLRARYSALRGRARAARASWSRAVELANVAEQPYEQIQSLRALAAYDPSKAELANQLAERYGMPIENSSIESMTTAAE